MFVVVAHVNEEKVEGTIVRVSFLAVLKGVVFLDKVTSSGMNTVTKPKGQEKIEKTATSQKVEYHQVRYDGEGSINVFPKLWTFTHVETSDDVETGEAKEPDKL